MNNTPMISRRNFVANLAKFGAAVAITRDKVVIGPDPKRVQPVPPKAFDETWQIGCYTRPWDQFDYQVALDAISLAGFRYVGLMTAKGPEPFVITKNSTIDQARQVSLQVKSRGLKAASMYGGEFSVSDSVKTGIAELKTMIDNCQAADASNLMIAGTTDVKLRVAYIQAIKECCPYAAEKGIGLSIKPHGGINATGKQLHEIIQEVGHPNFRIWYDPGNIFYYSNGELDPVTDAPSVDQLVVGVSIKDYVHPKEVSVTPGTGKVRFPEVLGLLKKGGFKRGPLLIECLSRGDSVHLLEQARKARKFLLETVNKL